MKAWPILVLFLAGCTTFSTVNIPTNWPSTEYDFYYWNENPQIPLPDYHFGDKTIHASDIGTTCEARYAIPDPSASCYTFFLASNIFDQNMVFHPGSEINASPYLSITGDASGGVTGDSRKTWQEQYKFYFAPNAITVQGLDQGFNQDLGTKTIKFSITNNLPVGIDGGVRILRTDKTLLQQQEIDVPLKLQKGQNTYETTIDFNKLGFTTLTITPYIKVYDYALGFTSQDTGVCFCANMNWKGQCLDTKCIQQKILSFGEGISYSFKTFPVGTDLSKNVQTNCASNAECPSTFSCQKNICEKQTLTSETLLQEAFIAQPRTDLIPAITAIALITIVTIVVVKANGK